MTDTHGADIEADLISEQRWEDLVGHHVEQAELAADPLLRQRAFRKAAAIFEIQLGDPEKALILMQEAWAGDFSQDDLAGDVERLAGHLGQFGALVEEYEQRLTEVNEIHQRVALLRRLARWYETFLNDRPSALARLQAALALDPTRVSTGRALAAFFGRGDDWTQAAQHLVRTAGAGIPPDERVALLMDAATIFINNLGDVGQAGEIYARVIETDPTHKVAVAALAEIAWSRKEWARALPLLEQCAQIQNDAGHEDRSRLHQRAATAALALGDADRAHGHGRMALQLHPGDVAFAKNWADVALDQKWWDEAATVIRTLLARNDHGLDRATQIDLSEKWGRALMAAGQPGQARAVFESVLAAAADHTSCRVGAITACEAMGDPQQALVHQRALLALAPPGAERFELLVTIGRRYRDDLKDSAAAILALSQALEEKPDDRALPHELLDLYTEQKDWKHAVAMLVRMAEVETTTTRAKYLVAAASILNYELRASDQAVELYERVLDDDPGDLKTFERLDKILTAKQAWRDEARAYRRMLKRLGPSSTPEQLATLLMLWRGLGEIYRTRMLDLPAAVAAFEVAAQLAGPDETQDHEILAEIFESGGGDTWTQAVQTRSLLVSRAQSIEDLARQLRPLRKLYAGAQQYDRVFAVCAGLVALGVADVRERDFYTHLAGLPLPMPHAGLTEELWHKVLYHPAEDRRLSVLLGALAPALALARAQDPKSAGLRDRARLDLDRDPSTLSRLVVVGGQMLGIGRPTVCLRPDTRGEIEVTNVRTDAGLITTFLVGSDLLGRQTERELGFIVGRSLAMLRFEHFGLSPLIVASRAELKLAVLSAIKLMAPAAAFPEESEPMFGQFLELFRRGLPPQNMEPLSVAVPALLGGDGRIDLEGWRIGAERTVQRAGLLLCGDVNVALRVLAQIMPPDQVAGASMDLLKFAVSPSYLTLREQLGLAIPREAVPTEPQDPDPVQASYR